MSDKTTSKKPWYPGDSRRINRHGYFRWKNQFWVAHDWPALMAMYEGPGTIRRIEVLLIKNVAQVCYKSRILTWAKPIGTVDEVRAQVRASKLAANAVEMLELLRPYLRHTNKCWMNHRSKKCTCGLAKILPEMEYETNAN